MRYVHSSMWKRVAALLLLVLLGVAMWRLLGRGNGRSPAAAPAPPRVPVVVEKASVRDVPHLTTGIGTVQSLHSVVVRSQVEGLLTAVSFKEGQMVRKGELLARIDDRTIVATVAQARAEKARNEAQLRAARLDLTRFNNLLKEEAMSRQAIDQQAALVAQLEATIAANQATIEAQEVRLSYTRITAPVSGRVGLRRVDQGNVVRAGDAEGLVTVAQVDPIAVIFTLPQDLLGRIQPLLRVPEGVPVTALDRDAGTALAEGRLLMIDNQVDSTTGTIRLKAEFPNREGKLLPGQFVTIQLRTGASPRAVVVSARAIQRGLSGAFVYRVRQDRAEVTPVTVSYENDQVAVIAKGLSAGDTVVQDGQSRLKPGSPVKATEAKTSVTEALPRPPGEGG
jgi:membrane fusion protein, multidrug efflux system